MADKFPNGFTSWNETHFEIVRFIIQNDGNGGIIEFTANMGGIGALYELAEEWTDEFEKNTMYRIDWDGEFFDEVEAFCVNKNKNNNHA